MVFKPEKIENEGRGQIIPKRPEDEVNKNWLKRIDEKQQAQEGVPSENFNEDQLSPEEVEARLDIVQKRGRAWDEMKELESKLKDGDNKPAQVEDKAKIRQDKTESALGNKQKNISKSGKDPAPSLPAVGEMAINERANRPAVGETVVNKQTEKRAGGVPRFDLIPESGLWERVSEKGKEFVGRAYERTRDFLSAQNIPESIRSNRLVGKLGVAYNQFWLDRHEAKAANLKRQMDSFDIRGGALDRSKSEIEGVVEDLKQQKIPGSESLELKAQDVERKKLELLNKKDKLQSKFEKRENKMKIYAERRDAIADRLISRYDEKLRPLQSELGQLETHRDKADLLIDVAEAKHKQREWEIAGVEKRKGKIEASLRAAGISDREIRKSTKVMEEYISLSRKKISEERAVLKKKRAEINEKVAKVDARANPYRDRRESFVRVKSGRPLEMNVPTRTRGEEFVGQEETSANTRAAAIPEGAKGRGTKKAGVEAGAENEKRAERHSVKEYIEKWNAYCKEQSKKTGNPDFEKNYSINQKEFMSQTGLGGGDKLDSEDFRNISSSYSRLKKKPRAEGKFFNEFTKLFEIKIGL